MSPTPSRLRGTLIGRLRPRRTADEGFTLVEVLVAMVVFALAASATAGMIVTGLRASLVAKLDTGAKNLAQERLELMRNLPFHLDQDTSASAPLATDDLLNYYYPNLSGASSTTSSGYVAACGAQTATCGGRPSYEPKSGSYYRRVFDPVPGYQKYRQYVTTQFIDQDRSPLGPLAGYDSFGKLGNDQPASQIVAVSVTTFWTAGQLEKSFKLETYIAAGRPAASRIALQSRAAALVLSTPLDANALLSYQAGVVGLDGALASGTIASAKAQGAFADVSGTDLFAGGALLSASAPPNVAPGSDNLSARSLTYDGRVVADFGTTSVRQVGAAVSGGLPNVGTASLPVAAGIAAHGPGQVPLRLSPTVAMADRLMLLDGMPLAWVTQVGGNPVAEGSGYLTSTAGSGRYARAGATASTLALHLFPTVFAPDGVVQVTLSALSLTCQATGAGGGLASLSYAVVVSYWNGAGYTTLTASQADATDPLAALNLTTVQVGVDAAGAPIYLSEFVGSWGTLGASGVSAGQRVENGGRRATASYTGVASITTQPLRADDPTSALSLQLGQASCTAEDNR